jgi:phenylpropionate dioxygenase-like ring-hydroxylating dioxygenase large terminal subunit
MYQFTEPKSFNRVPHFLEGWYWVMGSAELAVKKAKPADFLGKNLVVYRGEDGTVRALDAYCPHMGAHLAEGTVEGNGIRCLFHGWKFGEDGQCQDIPCLSKMIQVETLARYPVREAYGMIWVWVGAASPGEFPEVPEYQGQPVDFMLGNRFVKDCHPNIVMINAIDAQHFNTVHPAVKKLAGGLNLETVARNEYSIQFNNSSPIQKNGGLLNRLLQPFYAGALTYSLCYWFGSTGTVSIGPDFLHFHIMFSLRPTADGKAEGQTILFTKKRHGIFGKMFNKVILVATNIVGQYFAKGDTQIFKTIRFALKTPIAEDTPIMRFIKHAEKQKLARWGFSDPEKV